MIDLDYLTRQTAGDHALERELLALFVQQCAAQLRAIHAATEVSARIDAAHALKGTARAIGAWAVADAAAAMETELAGSDQFGTERAWDALALAAAEARAAIIKEDCAA